MDLSLHPLKLLGQPGDPVEGSEDQHLDSSRSSAADLGRSLPLWVWSLIHSGNDMPDSPGLESPGTCLGILNVRTSVPTWTGIGLGAGGG